MKEPAIEKIIRFMDAKKAEFERLTGIEYSQLSLAKTPKGEYVNRETEKLWTFWLQAYAAGVTREIERPTEE